MPSTSRISGARKHRTVVGGRPRVQHLVEQQHFAQVRAVRLHHELLALLRRLVALVHELLLVLPQEHLLDVLEALQHQVVHDPLLDAPQNRRLLAGRNLPRQADPQHRLLQRHLRVVDDLQVRQERVDLLLDLPQMLNVPVDQRHLVQGDAQHPARELAIKAPSRCRPRPASGSTRPRSACRR